MLDQAAPRPANPSAGLLIQMLAWIDARPRQYAQTMDAWRTSCPRLSVWEDAVDEGLVQIDGAGPQSQASVRLTPAGIARLQARP